MTNGLGGRTNGLTNGLGGRTNGLTNGLGRTNGLTNGLGSGGPVMRSRRMDDSAISPFRISLIIVVAFIILVPSSFLLVSQNEAAYSGIRVDGDFSDWDDSTMYPDSEQHAVASLDIVTCSIGTNDAGSLFLYAAARDNWMSANNADGLMAFIDSDGNPATGYAVRGFGADYLVDVYGWNGAIQGKRLGVFSGQDQLNWSAWNWRGINAAFTLTELEIGISNTAIQMQPAHSILFMTVRGDAPADICDAAIGLGKGSLAVKQISGDQNGILTSDQAMTLELSATGSAVEVTSVDFAYSGIAAPTVSGLPVTVQPGTPVTLSVTSPLAGLNGGTFVELGVSSVTCSGVPTVLGETFAAYAHSAPGTIRIDGAFADWNAVPKSTDPADVGNPNIDIVQHAAVNSTLSAFFYLRVSATGKMMGGSSVPQARSVTTPGPVEPGQPGTPSPLPKVTGEDITRIYIDTKSGGQSIGGIGADYMVEIKGKNGRITGRTLYSLPGKTFVMNIDAANNLGELEVGVPQANIGLTGNLSYFMESTDWGGGSDRTAVASTASVGGTRGGGSGTVGDPYMIENVDELQAMNNNKAAHYALKNDIDASITSTWNSGAGFVPVGTSATKFTGSLDGRGYTITGLYINRPSTNYVGLFGYIGSGSVVKNAGLVEVSITGNNYVGGLVGCNSGLVSYSHATGTIKGLDSIGGLAGYNANTVEKSYSKGTVTSTGTTGYVGGLVGYNDGGFVDQCYASTTISGYNYIGGLLGYNSYGTIYDSYSMGSVKRTGNNPEIGGFIGYNYDGQIMSCYSLTKVDDYFISNNGFLGGIGGSPFIVGNFWDIFTSGQFNSFGEGLGAIEGKDSSFFFVKSTFSGWDFNNKWWMIESGTRPMLRMEWSTKVRNSHQLQMMVMDTSADYVLANDIDCSNTDSYLDDIWDSAGFVPVGTNAMRFSGSLDACGYSITDLYINRPATDDVGLFGYIDGQTGGGVVKNVEIVNADITGYGRVGTLVAWNYFGFVSNSFATGTVSGNFNVGGLAGVNQGMITNTYANVAVQGDYRVGGLVGLNNGDLYTSYSIGNVAGNSIVGGLIGSNSLSVFNSYSWGDVTRLTETAVTFGGFVGLNFSNISNCYSIGMVIYAEAADPADKGFAGQVSDGMMSGNFWDTESSLQSTNAAGGATGKTTAEMKAKSTFVNWDFDIVWHIWEDVTYPLLQWQDLFPVANINTGEFFDTIQAAIDDAETLGGHTIKVANGSFPGGITVNKAIHLIGDGMYNTTIIDAEGGVGIHVTADGATVSDFKIFNGAIGIFLDNVQNVAVSYVNTSHNDDGILLSGSDSNIIFDCTFYENGCGLRLLSSNSNSIYHNLFLFNTIQAYDDTGTNTWDDGYPSGGNYWSDYTGDDDYSGPDQDIPGSDGFGDTPYTDIQGGMGAQDRYPIPEFQTILLPIFATFCIALISWKRRRLHG